MDVANGLVGVLEEHNWKLMTRRSKKEVFRCEPLKMVSEVKAICVLCEYSSRSNMVNKVAHSLYRLISKAAKTARMLVLHGPSNMDFYSPRPSGYSHC